ncbi:hypothetical protein [Priestia megaterium]
MGKRMSYPVEVKLKAIEMRLAGVPVKEVMETLHIKYPIAWIFKTLCLLVINGTITFHLTYVLALH